MGEATYYMKIETRLSDQEIEELAPKIKEFIREGIKAEDFWQNHRDKKYTEEWFWNQFEELFPIVTEYLKQAKDYNGNLLWGKDKHNTLAGHLDFGWGEDDMNFFVDENGHICYSAVVWHFAEWDNMCRFIEDKYEGVTKASWLSDEYLDTEYFGLL